MAIFNNVVRPSNSGKSILSGETNLAASEILVMNLKRSSQESSLLFLCVNSQNIDVGTIITIIVKTVTR